MKSVKNATEGLGLEPGGTGGTYRQPITFRRALVEGESAAFSVGGADLVYASDFSLSPRVLTDATDLRLIMLEVLTDPDAADRIGRADNGNAVLDGFEATAVSVADPEAATRVRNEIAQWARENPLEEPAFVRRSIAAEGTAEPEDPAAKT